MKLCLDRKKVNNVLEERGKTVRDLAIRLELSTAEIYQKFSGKSGVSLKQLNNICFYLMKSEHKILTDESLEDLDDYRTELEHLDTLNAQY